MFADEWKARLERGDITPGFDSTDATRMDFALFEEWFLTHTQDLGASIRHRNEFFSYTGMGVPVDQVLHMAQMLQQRCNQHTESPKRDAVALLGQGVQSARSRNYQALLGGSGDYDTPAAQEHSTVHCNRKAREGFPPVVAAPGGQQPSSAGVQTPSASTPAQHGGWAES